MAASIEATTIAYFKLLYPKYGGTSDTVIAQLIRTVSHEIERYTDRWLKYTQYTEYFDNERPEDAVFHPKATPIKGVTGYYDQDRDFTSSDVVASDSLITTPDGKGVAFVDYKTRVGRKVVKLVYNGGLAPSTNQVTLNLTGVSGSFSTGDVLSITGTSGNAGILGSVVSWDPTGSDLVVLPTSTEGDARFGGFATGSIYNEGTGTTGASNAAYGTITTFDTENLINDYPDIALAACLQIQYEMITRDEVGQSTVSERDQSRTLSNLGQLAPEVKARLMRYRRIPV